MQVLKLEADNFKNLKAVEITPDGNMVVVGGDNEQGKSSVMDAIWVAIRGRSAAPPKPIRNGEEECRIALDLGDLKVTRTFKAKDGGTYTDSVKVENDAGLRYSKPQEVLDALLGTIGFDPFDFVRMKPAEQAATLLDMVPLSVDLDEMGEADRSDYDNRRDANRDAMQLKAQVDALPKEDIPTDVPDREALVAALGDAANTNSAIERERMTRQQVGRNIDELNNSAASKSQRAEALREEADALNKDAERIAADATKAATDLAALPPIGEPVDVDEVRRQLSEAEATLAVIDRGKRRLDLSTRYDALVAKSDAFTAAMETRNAERNKALSSAKMPIAGLAFSIDERGKPTVVLNDVPFEQASTAAKLKASTAIAMAANPDLRVLRISDGSLLDPKSMQMLADMAKADDFQLWIEVVGEGKNVGIVMENGEVRAAKPEAKPAAKPKAEAPAAKTDGALL